MEAISFLYSPASLIYWFVFALQIAGTHVLFHRSMIRQENFRWSLGWIMVFFNGGFMLVWGHWPTPEAVFFGLFVTAALAGCVKMGLENVGGSLKAGVLRLAYYASKATDGGDDGAARG